MLEAFRADPCRFIDALLDIRQFRRLWHAWRRRGADAILNELSSYDEQRAPLSVLDNLPHRKQSKSALLVIDISIPQYDRDSGSRSLFLYIQILCELGHKVYFMPNDHLYREPYASELEKMGVHLLIGRGYRCGQWKKWLKLHASQISHVVLYRPNVAKRYLLDICEIGGIKVLYFACDLRFVRESRHYQVSGDVFHLQEAEYWEAIERQILAKVEKAYFFSDEETRAVASWVGGENARTVPIFPMDIPTNVGLSYEHRAGLLFVGGFAHHPNLDAVSWFASEVFPLVRQALPGIAWHIVGREPPPEIVGLAGNGIVVEGGVTESRLGSLYWQSRLVVAPLRFGAGVKGKVVEAMSYGVPVVTTPVGAEGIPDSIDALQVATTAQDMARQIIETYENPVQWEIMRKRIVEAADEWLSRKRVIHFLEQELTMPPASD